MTPPPAIRWRSWSTPARRTPSSPTTAQAVARSPPPTAGSGCWRGSRATALPEPPPRVLVAERSATIALFACALLHRWGYAAEPAATAQDVAAALAQGGFALVLAETGFFTGPASPALPWLALCSQAEAQAPAGAAGRVEKPLQAAALRAAVEHALRPAPAAPDIDLAEIVLNWDGPDDPNFRRVADVFLAWIVDQPDAMAAALAAGDRVALHREAH